MPHSSGVKEVRQLASLAMAHLEGPKLDKELLLATKLAVELGAVRHSAGGGRSAILTRSQTSIDGQLGSAIRCAATSSSDLIHVPQVCAPPAELDSVRTRALPMSEARLDVS